MNIKKLSEKDIEYLLEGAAILGTGGGGSPKWGREITKNDFNKGREYRIVDPDDVEDDAFIVSGGIMGSVKTLEEMNLVELIEEWEQKFPLQQAFIEMEKETGKKIDYLVPFEIGGLNTPVILSVAARLGIPVVDGDGLGRAAPETQMTSFMGHGISLTPMVLVDKKENVVIVRKSTTPFYPDELGRWVVTRGGGLGANNHYPMFGKQFKQTVIPRTISRTIEIGEKIITARNNGLNPIEVFANLTGAVEIFQGQINSFNEKEAEGFYFTELELQGVDLYDGDNGKLIIKNEAMAFWKNKQLKAVFPDLLCILEPTTGRGVMSVELKIGLEIVLMGLPCHERLREAIKTSKGKIAFNPARYGQPNLTFIPIEKLN